MYDYCCRSPEAHEGHLSTIHLTLINDALLQRPQQAVQPLTAALAVTYFAYRMLDIYEKVGVQLLWKNHAKRFNFEVGGDLRPPLRSSLGLLPPPVLSLGIPAPKKLTD